MSKTLNKAVEFLDAAVAQLDTPTRAVPDHSVIELRREKAALDILNTGISDPKPEA